MAKSNPLDPYADNILTQGLGPILSRQEALSLLTYLPPQPSRDIGNVPKHIRMHLLLTLRDLHIPTLEGGRLVETIDLMIRPSYRYRDPKSPPTWGMIYGEQPMGHKTPRAPAMAAAVVGHSGTGKTEAILRGLNTYRSQIVTHDSFPNIVGKHNQVVYLSVDTPASGRSADLATNLMRSWDMVMSKHFPGKPERFASTLAKERRDGPKMLDEWRHVASSHFLGLLHLDEIQNFFQLQSLEKRKKRTDKTEGLQLSIVEDYCLKWILTLTNTWQTAFLASGTPDGIGALTKRLSNTERFVSSGYHVFPHFEDATNKFFFEIFFKHLVNYQYVKTRLPATPELAQLIIELTGGIPRLIIALWIAAHRVAFERIEDDLRFEDFKRASETYLAPVGPAVAALRSKDPLRMAKYEDLIPRDDGYWATFWTSVSSI